MKHLSFLDGLRGIASLLVMLGHARMLLWEGFSSGYMFHTQLYSKLDKYLMYIFSIFRYGHEMVMLFFILSGFVIHLRYSDRDNRLDINLKKFWYRRLKRLYPPLIFLFLFAFLLDTIGKSFGWSIYVQQTAYSNINQNIESVIDVPTFLGNCLFLMTVYVKPFGTTGATWSLMYEWWFYILYPVFYYLALRVGFRKVTFLVLLLYFISFYQVVLFPFLLWKVLDSFIIWWLGVCLAEIWTNRSRDTKNMNSYLHFLSFLLLFAFFLKEKDSAISLYLLRYNDIFWGIGFVGLISFLLTLNTLHPIIKFLNWVKPLGDCSYTLYLIHGTIFIFIAGGLISKTGGLPHHHFYVILAAIGVSIIAYLLHFLIEKPFINTKPS
jgi:peptidoglycan/LPS O-acetylase OafA/YrhL